MGFDCPEGFDFVAMRAAPSLLRWV